MAIVDPWSLCHVIYKVLQQFDPNVVMLDICYGIIHKKGQKEKQGNESRESERERESFSFILSTQKIVFINYKIFSSIFANFSRQMSFAVLII